MASHQSPCDRQASMGRSAVAIRVRNKHLTASSTVSASISVKHHIEFEQFRVRIFAHNSHLVDLVPESNAQTKWFQREEVCPVATGGKRIYNIEMGLDSRVPVSLFQEIEVTLVEATRNCVHTATDCFHVLPELTADFNESSPTSVIGGLDPGNYEGVTYDENFPLHLSLPVLRERRTLSGSAHSVATGVFDFIPSRRRSRRRPKYTREEVREFFRG